MSKSYLVVTDGTTRIDLLGARGWAIKNWYPEIPQPKGGGIFRSSPLVDGRRLSMRKFDNAIETMTMVLAEQGQDRIIFELQELLRLLQKATEYWTSNWQNEPVWLEAEGPCESERRYAIIMDYRLSGLNNPYAQPFFGPQDGSAMDNLTLAIERGHWQDVAPGDDGTCVEVSSQYEAPTTIVGDLFYGADTYDDTIIYPAGHSPTFPVGYLQLGDIPDTGLPIEPGEPYGRAGIGLHFTALTVPAGSTVTYGRLTMKAHDTLGTGPIFCLVYVGLGPAIADFNCTIAQLLANLYPMELVDSFMMYPIVLDTTYNYDVTRAVNYYINSSVYSGNDIFLYVLPYYTVDSDLGVGEYREFYDQGDISLYIEYVDPTTVGADATCANEVFIGNKHTKASITHAYYYDAGTATFSAPLLGSGAPYNLLPAVPAVGDCLYIGSCDTLTSYGPLFNVVFDIGTAGVDISGEWQYYDNADASWHNLDGTVVGTWVCGNVNFTETGVSHVTFRIGPEQDATTINLITGYWIRYYVTAIGAAPAAPTQDSEYIYTVLNPYVDIDSLQVPGDIPAASRIIVDCGGCSWRRTSTLNIALRSLSRGDEFDAYLNVAYPPDGISFYPADPTTYPLTAIEVSSKSPCGYVCESRDITTSLTEMCYWSLSPELAAQYIGNYHAFLRCEQVTGAAGEVEIRVKATMGTGYNVNYSDTNKTQIINWAHAVDLGKIVIPNPYSMRSGDIPTSMKISVEIYNPSGRELDIYDLVLFPTDEWMGTFSTSASGLDTATGYVGKRYDIDNITNPRTYRATLSTILNDTQQTIDAELMRVASSPPMLQANRDQRLWFFQTFDTELKAHFETISSVRVQRAARYLAMRGNR